MQMQYILFLTLILYLSHSAEGFAQLSNFAAWGDNRKGLCVSLRHTSLSQRFRMERYAVVLRQTDGTQDGKVVSTDANRIPIDVSNGESLASTEPPLSATRKYTPEEERQIGNLCADDEWMGLTMEVSELVRTAILEELKASARDFLGKDSYKFGDVSKELDARIKEEVAKLRGKEEYELGDLSLALDKLSKEAVCSMTGKPVYELGDLSLELDKRVKKLVAGWNGKEEYKFGDLSRIIDVRVKERVAAFTSKDSGYEFGDISKEIERRRREWVKDFLGTDEYRFGDISKRVATSFTGKDTYQFGDISKKVVDNIFGKRKRGTPKPPNKDASA